MRRFSTIVILSLILHSTMARHKRPRPNPVMGALQSILSPANAEKTMHLLKMATHHSLGNTIAPGNPQILSPSPVKFSPPILPSPEPCNYIINQQVPTPNLLPNTFLIPSPAQNQVPIQVSNPMPIQTPSPIQVQMPNTISFQMPVQLPSQMQLQVTSPPSQLPVQLPSSIPLQLPSTQLQLPCRVPQLPTPLAPIPIPEVIIERPPCPCEREIIYPFADIPNYIYNPPFPPNPEVTLPIALTAAEDIYGCPIPSPATLFNLSPVPPACSCTQESSAGSRSQYLRKIPIPPPTL